MKELQKLAKDALGVAAKAILDHFLYARMPPHLNKSVSQANLEKGRCEHFGLHLQRELEINSLEAPIELQEGTVAHQPTQPNPEKPEPTCHHCKKPGHYRNQCRQLKREKDQAQNNTNSAGNNINNNGGQANSSSANKIPNSTNTNKMNNQKDKKSKPVYPICDTCGKNNHSSEKC